MMTLCVVGVNVFGVQQSNAIFTGERELYIYIRVRRD